MVKCCHSGNVGGTRMEFPSADAVREQALQLELHQRIVRRIGAYRAAARTISGSRLAAIIAELFRVVNRAYLARIVEPTMLFSLS